MGEWKEIILTPTGAAAGIPAGKPEDLWNESERATDPGGKRPAIVRSAHTNQIRFSKKFAGALVFDKDHHPDNISIASPSIRFILVQLNLSILILVVFIASSSRSIDTTCPFLHIFEA